MPNLTVVPQAQVTALNPNEAFSTTASLIQLLEHKKSIDLENHLLEQQLSLHQQLDPLEVQVKQVQLQNEQRAGKLDELVGPMKTRLLGAQATSAEEETAALPGKLQDEAKQRTMAQALVSQQLDNAKLSGQISSQQYEEQKRLFPLHVEETQAKIAETVQNVNQSRAYTEYLKTHAAAIVSGKSNEQASQIINTWDGIDPHARQMIKESPDFKDNPVIQALPTTGKMRKSDIMQMFNDKIQEVWDDPNSTPAAKAGANQMLGTMLQLTSGTYKVEEQADNQATILGTKRQSLQDKIGSFLQLSTKKNPKTQEAKTGTSTTQPSADATDQNGTFVLPKTGLDEVDRTVYHTTQQSAAANVTVGDAPGMTGAKLRAINRFNNNAPVQVERDGKTFDFKSTDTSNKLMKIYSPQFLADLKAGGDMTGMNEDADYLTLKKSMIVDPKATLQQQSIYESIIKSSALKDLNTKDGIKSLEEATNKLVGAWQQASNSGVSTTPPLTDQHLLQIKNLINYFDEEQ